MSERSTLDDAALGQLCARAASLDERMGTISAASAPLVQLSDAGHARLRFWEALVERGGLSLDQRLGADGWERSRALHALESAADPGALPASGTADVPEWARLLKAVSSAAVDASQIPLRRARPKDSQLPFEPLLEPFLSVARAELLGDESLDGRTHRLLADSIESLSQELKGRLVWLTWRTFFAEFAAERPPEMALRAAFESAPQTQPSSQFFDAWTAAHLRDGFHDLFLRYPVLARLTATSIRSWCRSCREVVQRLVDDWELLTDVVGFPAEHPDVVGITTGLSDPHRSGRTVARVTFSSGRSLYYKPRSTRLEEAYNGFLDYLNGLGARPPLRSLKVISREGHGWSEAAESMPCEDDDGVARFYEEAGALLCVLDVLGAADAHGENIIASGSHPILIDAEAVMHPEAPRPVWTVTPLLSHLANSVLRTGLLPRWDFSLHDQHPLTMNGLWTGAVSALESSQLVAPNTDQQSIGVATGGKPALHNAPWFKGRAYACTDHVDEIISGYTGMHRLFQANRHRIVSSQAFTAFSGLAARYVLRRTATYAHLLELGNSPGVLKEGVERSLTLELLNPSPSGDDASLARWWIARVERQALWRMDIPHFQAATDAATLVGPVEGEELPLGTPSYAATRDRILTMDEGDLDIQVALVHQVLTPPRSAARESESVSFRRCADEIVEELLERRLGEQLGDIGWIGVRYDLAHNTRSFQAVGPGLYEGLAGIGLVLASYQGAGGALEISAVLDLIIKNLAGVHARVDRLDDAALSAALPIGMGAGTAGLMYALSHMAVRSERSDAANLAVAFSSLLSRQLRTAPRGGDILTGLPGVAMALMSAWHATRASEIWSLLRLVAERLLAERSDAWARLDLTGLPDVAFAHGVSGVLSTFMRLHVVLEDERFAAPVTRLMPHLQRRMKTWVDCDPSEMTAPDYSWCNGIVGVGSGLVEWARWRSLLGEDTDEFASTLDALCTRLVEGSPHSEKDVLCCGNWGAVEMLADAASTLGREHLAQASRTGSRLVASRPGSSRVSALADSLIGVFNPGLFQGYAGIALALLRLGDPTNGPAILRFGL